MKNPRVTKIQIRVEAKFHRSLHQSNAEPEKENTENFSTLWTEIEKKKSEKDQWSYSEFKLA